MYNDTPFGYGLFPHDEQISVNTLITQSKQFDAINTKGNHVWIVIHKADDTHIVKEAMIDRGYKNLQNLFWYKPDHYVEGPVNRLTPAVEMITVGFLPNSSDINWNVSSNPRERHNHIAIPSVSPCAKDSAGNIINVTEKPPGLAEYLLSMWCQKGSTVLIIGTGAGGCVKGALRAGINVIGVENDEIQYHQLYSEMNAWVANMQREKEAAEPAQPKSKKAEKSTDLVKGTDKEVGDVARTVTSVTAAQVEGLCFSCDLEALSWNPLGECVNCHRMNHVKECMRDYETDDGNVEGLVCNGCHESLFGKEDY